jgi:hypothetical protein
LDRVRLNPKLARDANDVDACFGPPSSFVASAVYFTMVSAAERHRKFVAHLKA